MLMRLFFTLLFVSERKQIAFMAAEKSPALISQRLFATSRSEMRIIMKLNQIITSLLETDMYKFSMGQAIYHQFSDYKTTWSFKCRNTDVHFTKEVVEEIKEQIKAYCGLRFTEEELEYLHNIKWIKGSYVDFLRLWQPRYEDFEITTDAECGLSIEAKGTWLNTSMYEIPTLAIINEVYFRMEYNYDELLNSFKNRLDEKIRKISTGEYNIGSFSEFGLRRRLSAKAQELAVDLLSKNEYPGSKFVGTSNVYLAKKYNLTPVGTMAHEWIMCVGQGNHKHNPAYSNWYALDAWVKEYGILNGTALSDAITTDCFLKDFQLTYATLFSGVRHDSGDPYEWGDKMLKHYESLGIDPMTKTLLFSDSLDFKCADGLNKYFNTKARVAFGIGTYISNDTDVPALNIVMKTTACNGMDVAKISDIPGKGMCKNPDYVHYLRRCIDWRMKNDR
jgi:nicotinate phosphoribosyltransferase